MPWIFRRPRSPGEIRAQVDEELEFHLERKAREIAESEGLPIDAAREEAIRRFGDLERTRVYCAEQSTAREREATLMTWFDELRQDLAYALRTLRKSPTYTAVVVATLALGIAANTVIFSVMNPYLLRELPYDAPDELVQLGHVEPRTGWDSSRMSLAMYEDYRTRSRAFDELAIYTYTSFNLTDGDTPRRANVGVLSANLFAVLGVEASVGRTFLPEEVGPGGENVIVLDHGVWRERYGADSEALGRTIRLNGTPYEVIGVMPPDFVFPWNEVRYWIPLRTGAAGEPRDATRYHPVGRLADGWTRERAEEELAGIQRELARTYPKADGEFSGVRVHPLRSALNFAWDQIAVAFPMLLAAVVFVLLIVCVNVASLTLARATSREEEVAVRAALGAGRIRLVRQLLTESAVLAVVGGSLGLLLAFWAVSVIAPHVPDALYRVGDVSLDGRVLAYTAVLSLATPFFFGLIPALVATRRDLATTLRAGGRGSGAAPKRLRGRRGLVVAEVALGIVLVTGAGLMLRSFAEVQKLDLGFEPDRILSVNVRLPEASYETRESVQAFFDRAVEEIGALPGVDAVGATSALPMNHEVSMRRFARPGAGAASDDWPTAYFSRVSSSYFVAMEIPLRAGRPFRSGDIEERGVIISESLARRHFGGESPVGATLLAGDRDDPDEYVVVGVVADVRQADLIFDERPQLYRPLDETSRRRRFLTVRAGVLPGSLVGPVRSAIGKIDADLAPTFRPMSEIETENTFIWGIGSVVLAAFGLFALLLACLGIYGVIAYSVERRRREMGIRMALGARAAEIRTLIVGEGLRLAGIGLGVGLVLAAGAGQLMTRVLYGVSPLDPVALAGTLVIFAVVAVGSSWFPARRAARSRPARVLREE